MSRWGRRARRDRRPPSPSAPAVRRAGGGPDASRRRRIVVMMPAVFFRLTSWELALLIFAITASFTAAGFALGRYLREHSGTLREPFGVLQGALLGIVGLM